MSGATILHADLDAFYASVEQRDDPSLRGKPVIVGGGVVLAASYEARRRGVRKAMGGGAARRVCPEAIVVRPRFNAYLEASRLVRAVFDDMTPIVEPISIDEAFLDVGGARRLLGTPAEIGERIRRRVRDEIGLPVSVGIATTKFLAKVASAASKPDGLIAVPEGGELEFLHPLPVNALWGVGPVTTAKLERYGIRTVGDLAALDVDSVQGIAGGAVGRHLHSLARNVDVRRVSTTTRRRSIGSQQALGNRHEHTHDDLHASVLAIAERVTRRMRSGGWLARTVVLRLRYGDFVKATRSHTIDHATDETTAIYAVASKLLDAELHELDQRGITLIGLAMTNLARRNELQLALPFGPDRRALDGTVDQIREKFGRELLTPAALLSRPGLREPLGIELIEPGEAKRRR
ncbi:MAG: DNA polymerase IV [Acidimicrobiia bacterium]